MKTQAILVCRRIMSMVLAQARQKLLPRVMYKTKLEGREDPLCWAVRQKLRPCVLLCCQSAMVGGIESFLEK